MLWSSLSQELSSPDQSAELQSQNRAVVWQIPRLAGGTQLSALFKVSPPPSTNSCQPPPQSSHQPLSGPLSLCSQLDVPGLSSASMLEVGPVGLSFELPKFTATGLQIRFLRLSPVQPAPSQRWVRYVTHSDSYSIRI